jgi:hypothetical protein
MKSLGEVNDVEKIYDERYEVIGYVVRKLKSYFNQNARVCGLCMYPYELVRVRRVYSRIEDASRTSPNAIVYVKHDHRHPNSKPTLIVVKWITDEEVHRYMNMEYDELMKELEMERGEK